MKTGILSVSESCSRENKNFNLQRGIADFLPELLSLDDSHSQSPLEDNKYSLSLKEVFDLNNFIEQYPQSASSLQLMNTLQSNAIFGDDVLTSGTFIKRTQLHISLLQLLKM